MNISIIGSGKSGLAAAKLAKKLGYKVFLTESNNHDKYRAEISQLKRLEIEYEFGGNTEKALECELIVSSPGVPPYAEIIKKADKNSIPIISELEFASKFLDNKIIAITGTNGKTTVTALVEHILKQSGKKAIAAGNIGNPLSSLYGVIDEDTIIVAECSSYQLDRTVNFTPDVFVILNITPDHLDYHGTMDNYVEAKWKTSYRLTQDNLLILNNDDCAVMKEFEKRFSGGRIFKTAGFSLHQFGGIGAYIDGDDFILSDKHKEVIMKHTEIGIPGVHNLYNSMAAALAARAFEISNENLRDSLMSFKGVAHRLEFVRELNGIKFINDSKATNINSTWYALSSFISPIVWVAGGKLANNDYSQIASLVKDKVKSIIAIGEEKNNIFNYFSNTKRVHRTNSLDEAVMLARKEADEDNYVVFSPACKSFDMFTNFEERGNEFKQIVNSL